jgi:hypothetical protein
MSVFDVQDYGAVADGDYGILTLDVAPVTDWEVDDIITGQSSGVTCVVVSKTSSLVYRVKYYTGLIIHYTLGETVGVTGDANKLADQGAANPVFTSTATDNTDAFAATEDAAYRAGGGLMLAPIGVLRKDGETILRAGVLFKGTGAMHAWGVAVRSTVIDARNLVADGDDYRASIYLEPGVHALSDFQLVLPELSEPYPWFYGVAGVRAHYVTYLPMTNVNTYRGAHGIMLDHCEKALVLGCRGAGGGGSNIAMFGGNTNIIFGGLYQNLDGSSEVSSANVLIRGQNENDRVKYCAIHLPLIDEGATTSLHIDYSRDISVYGDAIFCSQQRGIYIGSNAINTKLNGQHIYQWGSPDVPIPVVGSTIKICSGAQRTILRDITSDTGGAGASHGIIDETPIGETVYDNVYQDGVPFTKTVTPTCTRASNSYMELGDSLLGPFTSNSLATGALGADTWMQVEKAQTTLTLYSEQLNTWMTGLVATTWSPDAALSPLNEMVMDKLCETNGGSVEYFCYGSRSIGWINAKEYICYGVAKVDERKIFQVEITASSSGVADTHVYFNTIAKTATITLGGSGYATLRKVGDYWFWAFSVIATSTVTSTVYRSIYLYDDAGNRTHVGVAGYGAYFWGFNIIQNAYELSYCKSTATVGTKEADVVTYAEADVAPFIRATGFKFRIKPNYSSTRLALDAQEHYLMSFETTDEDIDLYFSADGKLNIRGSVSGALLVTSALTWSALQVLDITVEHNRGGTSALIVAGATTNNGLYSGTSYAVADGDLWIGQTKASAKHFDGKMTRLAEI